MELLLLGDHGAQITPVRQGLAFAPKRGTCPKVQSGPSDGSCYGVRKSYEADRRLERQQSQTAFGNLPANIGIKCSAC